MCKVNFKIFDLTLASKGIVEDFNVGGTGCGNLGDLETLQALKFAED